MTDRWNTFSQATAKSRFLMRLWREHHVIRQMLDSENFRFVRAWLPGHFYSPIPDIKEVRAQQRAPSEYLGTEILGIDLCEDAQLELAYGFTKYYSEISFPETKEPNFRYCLDNDFFSYGDGVILYSIMRQFRPRRVVEVGSGFSSAAMLDVNERFLGSEVGFTFIEPSPDRLLSLLRREDFARHDLVEKPLQEIPHELFSVLNENDILFVDSSQVVKAYSDVAYLLFKILPSLNRGVLIHFHDVGWPFEYPILWFEEGRAWNEAYFLRAFLELNDAFSLLYFNSMMEARHADVLRREMPLVMKKLSSPVTLSNTSLWVRKIQ